MSESQADFRPRPANLGAGGWASPPGSLRHDPVTTQRGACRTQGQPAAQRVSMAVLSKGAPWGLPGTAGTPAALTTTKARGDRFGGDCTGGHQAWCLRGQAPRWASVCGADTERASPLAAWGRRPRNRDRCPSSPLPPGSGNSRPQLSGADTAGRAFLGAGGVEQLAWPSTRGSSSPSPSHDECPPTAVVVPRATCRGRQAYGMFDPVAHQTKGPFYSKARCAHTHFQKLLA